MFTSKILGGVPENRIGYPQFGSLFFVIVYQVGCNTGAKLTIQQYASTPPICPPLRVAAQIVHLSRPYVLGVYTHVCTPAITLLLLPFVGLGLFLLRRNFQRGGISRGLVAGLARKMAERGGVSGGGGFGPMMGSGGGGVSSMQGTPKEGALSSLLARMLGGGLRGMELVGVLRRCMFVRDGRQRTRRFYPLVH